MTSEITAATVRPDAVYCAQPRKSTYRKWLILAGTVLGVVVVVAVSAVILLVATTPTSRSVPAFATAEAIEATYPKLLNRMAKVASQGVYASEIDESNALVAPTEILEATAGSQNARMVIGNKKLDYRSKEFVVPRQPSLGHPVVNQYWYTLKDGRKLVVFSFEAKVLDANSAEKILIILFDPIALEKRLQTSQGE